MTRFESLVHQEAIVDAVGEHAYAFAGFRNQFVYIEIAPRPGTPFPIYYVVIEDRIDAYLAICGCLPKNDSEFRLVEASIWLFKQHILAVKPVEDSVKPSLKTFFQKTWEAYHKHPDWQGIPKDLIK